MKRHCVLILSLALLWFTSAYAQNPEVHILSDADWNVPRTNESILKMPALVQTMRDYDEHPDAKIQIRYPGGDEGTLWANEVRSWLVALGVASRHIELLPGSRKDGQLELQVMPPMTAQTLN
ncbi:MAG: hypothetical protein GC149_04445 [Gammaproteobacteria bacterium]|nr:hypothetical protein [Gammaproteobacteria bacterium]